MWWGGGGGNVHKLFTTYYSTKAKQQIKHTSLWMVRVVPLAGYGAFQSLRGRK